MALLAKKLNVSADLVGSNRIIAAKYTGREHNLRSIVSKTGATRILNLHDMVSDVTNDHDYLSRPMFMHPVLNRCIIMKFNLPVGAEDKLAPRRFNSTKIIFPFDKYDLGLGGQAIFVDQPSFETAISSLLDYRDFPLDRDLTVLRALDRLPTLDPFLIRETLSQQQIEVARCYCLLSEADKTEMLAFVAREIESLVALCFQGMENNDGRAQHLAHLLLAEQNSVGLEPLREIFRMKPGEFSDAMFCWKAFLYYRWRSQTLGPELKSSLRSMLSLAAGRFDKSDAALIDDAKEQLRQAVTTAWWQVGQRLKLYDQAFAALTDLQKPDDFRLFLMRGSGLFMELGTRIGQMEQVVSLWNYRFGAVRMTELSVDDVLAGLRDLLHQIVPITPPSILEPLTD